MQIKHCPECNQDLPKSCFTSNQAKYCRYCTVTIRLKKRNEMMKRSMERQRNKKPKKVTVESLASLKKSAQRVFNKWVRERDKDLPCISCQGNCGDWDAGHFWAQGSNGALRFDENNVHKQGRGCNRFKHGNLLEYRINLIKKIGQEKVEWLDQHHTDIKKWTREECEEVIRKYKL